MAQREGGEQWRGTPLEMEQGMDPYGIKEIVDCGPGQDTAYIDRGVDEVKDNCERKINGFPDMGAGASSREGSAGGPFGASSG
jgi:hypothetical protein